MLPVQGETARPCAVEKASPVPFSVFLFNASQTSRNTHHTFSPSGQSQEYRRFIGWRDIEKGGRAFRKAACHSETSHTVLFAGSVKHWLWLSQA